jgi:hypothetical protein
MLNLDESIRLQIYPIFQRVYMYQSIPMTKTKWRMYPEFTSKYMEWR